MLTMLLGGLWHGAATNFIVWGGLHGLFLMLVHTWKGYFSSRNVRYDNTFTKIAARALTYLAVVVAFVFFRSSTFDQAIVMLSGMLGLNGASSHAVLPSAYLQDPVIEAVALCFFLLCLVNLFPNTQQFMRMFRPVSKSSHDRTMGFASKLVWRPSYLGVCFVVSLGIIAILNMDRVQSFIYFRF
jgi:predicted metal-binding membrane protein